MFKRDGGFLSFNFICLLLLAMIAASPSKATDLNDILDSSQSEAAKVVREAISIIGTQGAVGVQTLLPDLQSILTHAPQPTAEPTDDAVIASWAGWAIGWYYNDISNFEAALVPLDHSLRLAPSNIRAFAERCQALVALKRYDEALAAYETKLSLENLRPFDRALFLRAKGFILTEKNELDAALAAYEEALRIEPDHVVAQREVRYIQGLQAGNQPTQILPMTTYGKAKTGTNLQPSQ